MNYNVFVSLAARLMCKQAHVRAAAEFRIDHCLLDIHTYTLGFYYPLDGDMDRIWCSRNWRPIPDDHLCTKHAMGRGSHLLNFEEGFTHMSSWQGN